MRRAAWDACTFVEYFSRDDFLADKRTQPAVVMNPIIIGTAATKIMNRFPAFVEQHPDLPWRSMRGMRNGIAYGYFDIDLKMMWDTVETALPELRMGLTF